MNETYTLAKDQVWYAPTTGATLTVTRVAKDQTWVDVKVTDLTGSTWSKRQPLVDGWFAFGVRRVNPGFNVGRFPS